MKPKDRELVTVGACALVLALWRGATLLAQQPAPEPEAGAPAVTAFPKGPLPPHVAEQVRAIVMAQVKAFLPPAEEGAVELDRLDKDTVLTATVGGQKYSAKVFRSFLVAPLNANEFSAKEYYVRTTAPWKPKADLVIPADIYLSGMVERVSAYDADMIAAQDAAIARSEVLSQASLGQIEQSRTTKLAAIVEAHKAQMDAVSARITQSTSEIFKKQEQRRNVTTQVEKLQTQTQALMNGKDADGKVIWDCNGTTLSFYDDLDQDIEALATARNEQATIQTMIDAAQSARVSPAIAATTRAIQTVLHTHRTRVLAGDVVGEDEMRQDYEAALGGALNFNAAAAPDTHKTKGAMAASPPQYGNE